MDILKKKVSQDEHNKVLAENEELKKRISEFEADEHEGDEASETETRLSNLETIVAEIQETVADHELRIAAIEGSDDNADEEAANDEEESTEASEKKGAKSLVALKKENKELSEKLSKISLGGNTPLSAGDKEGEEKKLAGIHPPKIQTEVNLTY
jgi:hypothetical protein